MSGQQPDQAARQYGLHQGYQNLQTQQQAVSSADQHANAAAGHGWFADALSPVLRYLDETHARTQFTDKLPAEVASLRQGLSTRSAPAFTPPNYQALPHTQLHQMVTDGVDPGTVGDVGDTWLSMGDDLTQFQNDIATALANSETTWQGAAGDAARASVATLGNKAATAGQGAQLAGVVTHQQAQALATAKNSMPPPPNPPYNPQTALQQLNTITDPVAYAKQASTDQQQAAAQKQAQQQAAHVVAEYDATIAQTSATMPSFNPPPPVTKPGPSGPSAPVSTGGPDGGGGHGSGGPTAPRVPGGGYVPPRTPNPIPGGSPTPVPPAPIAPGSQPIGQPGPLPTSTSTSDYTGPGQFGGAPPSNTGYGPYGGPAGGPNPTDGPGGGTFGPFGAGAMGGAAGFGGSGGGLGRGASGFGPLGSGAGGGAGGASRSGIGAGATAAEEAMIERGAAGTPGASGTGGMMPGGARGKGSEDEEHQRPSYLVERDPDSIFGTDQRTAPPVIGE